VWVALLCGPHAAVASGGQRQAHACVRSAWPFCPHVKAQLGCTLLPLWIACARGCAKWGPPLLNGCSQTHTAAGCRTEGRRARNVRDAGKVRRVVTPILHARKLLPTGATAASQLADAGARQRLVEAVWAVVRPPGTCT
jgi:hypothetical protein